MKLHPAAGLAWTLASTAAVGGCAAPAKPLDLLRAESALVEANLGFRDKPWVVTQMGRQVRINDLVLETLPASPPSRLRFRLDIPDGAHLSFACGVSPESHDKPGVEFVAKLVKNGRENVVFSSLLDPLQRPAHRNWVPGDVDLAKYAGKGVDLILETRGFEKTDDPKRAFWGSPALTVSGDQAPLAIIYLVDTLRADHTQPYGYRRDTTPKLLEFSKDAVVFEQAISHASWTKPAVASILTSLLPGKHRAVQLRDPLDLGIVTLAEMLEAKGYATGAAIANSVIYSAGTNFEQGFSHFAGLHGPQDRPSKLVEASVVVDEALRWLDSRRGFPRFLYVHTMDPHVPYAPPPPFDQKYGPHPTPDHPGVDPRSDYKEALDKDRLMAQYDGDIAYGDQEFGRFITELKKRGLYDGAIIAFVGDHGEEFQEHGQFLHGKSVFDELIQVPLLVKFPQQKDAGQRVRQQVQTGDILPTLLESLRLEVPQPPTIVGHPLQAVVSRGAPEPPVVSEISHRGFVANGMRTSRDKYIQRFSPQEDELYFDLLKDPREIDSRLEASKERVRLLRAGVEAVMVPNPFRHHLKFVGPGSYQVKLRTGGWILGPEPIGFSLGDHLEAEGSGRKLALSVEPRPGRPREVVFGLRPQGAPIYLEGTRNGKPLSAREVWIAEQGVQPQKAAWPLRLPEIEPLGNDDRERLSTNIFAPPRVEKAGLHIWLTMTHAYAPLDLGNKERCEELKALGYIQSCPG